MEIEVVALETEHPRSKPAKTTRDIRRRLDQAAPSDPEYDCNNSWDAALNFSANILEQHPWDPDGWELRRLLVEERKADLQVELDFVGKLLQDNAGNYEMWHHRRCIVGKLGTKAATVEFKFT